MTAIEPGTRVRVSVEGVVTERDDAWGLTKVSIAGGEIAIHDAIVDPAVQVVPIDSDQPTLDRESIAIAVRNADHAWTMGTGLKTHETWTGHLTAAIIDLIETAHPGLIR